MISIEQVSSLWRRFGTRGVQLLVLAYLFYRYLRAFLWGDEPWAAILWQDGSQQPQFNLDGISVPYIAVTIASPLIVLLLDYLSRAEEHNDRRSAESSFLSLTVLALATAFVWLSALAWDTGSFAYVRDVRPSFPFAAIYTSVSCVVAVLIVRTNRATGASTSSRASDPR